MKRLYLLRHAKSSKDVPGITDLDRPLNPRGKRQIREIGTDLKKRKIAPKEIFSSPARRARDTAEGIAAHIGFPVSKIKIATTFYDANSARLMHFIQDMDDSFDEAMLVGHNPEFLELADSLAEDSVETFPTCAVLCLDFKVDAWKKVAQGKGVVHFFEHPRKPSEGAHP